MPAVASLLVLATAQLLRADDPLDKIYACLLPRAAMLSLFSAILLLMRATAHRCEKTSCMRRLRRVPRFGRKGMLICGASVLFAASCVYRAINVADEGAYLCRGPTSAFNAPASGRAVATIGELALVLQVSSYLADTALRLAGPAALSPRYTMSVAAVAEACSWAGVLTGTAKCFCVEYVCWVGIALLWAWDASELLHKSTKRGDTIVHATLVAAGLGLAAFNIGHELPHFFVATPLNAPGVSESGVATPFSCTQDAESPIWFTRLPFFVTYFAGASACSATLAARYMASGSR